MVNTPRNQIHRGILAGLEAKIQRETSTKPNKTPDEVKTLPGSSVLPMKTFYFNTGVKPENRQGVGLCPGQIWRGTLQIPFDCDDVPDNAVFQFASDQTAPGDEHLIRREMHNTTMVSKYAFFQIPK